jgi:23S rRNA (cytidine2498-2'-O)-methyltransferase
MESPFLLAVAREGREELVKDEMSRRFLGSKFAFSRPGFLSFKAGDPMDPRKPGTWTMDATDDLVFPLRSALFAGKAVLGKDPAEGFRSTRAITKLPRCGHLHLLDFTGAAGEDGVRSRVARLEDWERETPGVTAALAPFIEDAGGGPAVNAEAKTGEGILQVFRVAAAEYWVGVSRLRACEFGFPGGESGVALPPDAPSRAYLKVEEAIRILERAAGGPIFRAGETAIEIGSAPGGACLALLERGLRVVGVDRGEMAPAVARHPRYQPVVSNVGGWQPPEDFRAEWFLIDMNAEAAIALRESKHVIEAIRPSLRGIFVTMKLNRPEFAVAAERLAESTARDLGLGTWFLKHLPADHQEMAFFGLVSKPGSRRA